jgi:hypothetical protein
MPIPIPLLNPYLEHIRGHTRSSCTGLNGQISIFGGTNLIAAFVFATAMYITVTIPAIRTVVTPVEGVDTREDQIEALRVLSAGNTLIIVLLGGVLALQVRERHVLWRAEHRSHDSLSLSLFFFRGFVTRTQGGAGVGAEIRNEGSSQNCGRGSERKRRCEEGSVTLRNDIYSYSLLTFV